MLSLLKLFSRNFTPCRYFWSVIVRVLQFPVLQFHVLQSGPSFSRPAFSVNPSSPEHVVTQTTLARPTT